MAITVKEKELNLLERLYVLEVVRGVALTTGHFVRNISVHIAHLFGLAKDKRGSETFQYPEQRRPLEPRLRTLHRLTKREDGAPRCVACMMCETVCPAHCISI
ncbi:MAG TPA: NADH-quinone oxidoreductase subunit I, partial [Acidobacteriota bacterium]|nr:NADH-quinone oxidoreductase subunit I [Acidobacteriota bacterium]